MARKKYIIHDLKFNILDNMGKVIVCLKCRENRELPLPLPFLIEVRNRRIK